MKFELTQGDTDEPLRVLLRDSKNKVVRLLSTDVVVFRMTPVIPGLRADISQPATVNDLDAGDVQYDWQAGDTDVAGAYDAEFHVTPQTGGGGKTFPSGEFIRVVIKHKASTA